MKYSLQKQLKEILFMQDIGENIQAYKNFAPNVTGGHIGIDIQCGHLDPEPVLYPGVINYVNGDTVIEITNPDEKGDRYEIMYGHCEDRIKIDTLVNIGDFVGKQDSCGPSIFDSQMDKETWSHLHLSIRKITLQEPDLNRKFTWDYRILGKMRYEYDTSVGEKTRDYFMDPKEFNIKIVERIATAIEKMEDDESNPNDVVSRYHNPGAIRGIDGKFMSFNSYAEGRAYLIDYLTRAASGKHSAYRANMTLSEFFHVYAPVIENNPDYYAKFVCEEVGLRSVNEPICDWLLTELAWAKKCVYTPYIAYPENDPNKELGKIQKVIKYLWNKLF